MYHLTITAINGRFWKTQSNHIKNELAEMMGVIATKGIFEDEDTNFVYVNPTQIVSIELIKD